MCIRFRIDLLSRAFSNQCVFDENARRISVDRKADTHRNVRAFKRKRMSMDGSTAMRLNYLFRESFKSRVLNSRGFFSVKASIYFAGDQLCAVRQCWGVCNGKVSWSPKRKLTVMINASFSEYIKPINHSLHHYTKCATVVVSAYLAQRHWNCKRAVTMKSVQKINCKEQTIRETCQLIGT